MTFNQATDYAFRAVLFLARKSAGEVTEAQIIAEQESIPMRFLLKIMPSLIKTGIVKSFRGVGGGYALAKSPREITLLDVVEAIEGPIRLNRCLIDFAYCSKQSAPHCAIHQSLGVIQEKLREGLHSYTFNDLLQ